MGIATSLVIAWIAELLSLKYSLGVISSSFRASLGLLTSSLGLSFSFSAFSLSFCSALSLLFNSFLDNFSAASAMVLLFREKKNNKLNLKISRRTTSAFTCGSADNPH